MRTHKVSTAIDNTINILIDINNSDISYVVGLKIIRTTGKAAVTAHTSWIVMKITQVKVVIVHWYQQIYN